MAKNKMAATAVLLFLANGGLRNLGQICFDASTAVTVTAAAAAAAVEAVAVTIVVTVGVELVAMVVKMAAVAATTTLLQVKEHLCTREGDTTMT